MPSSTSLGSRPRCSSMRAYSDELSPTRSGVSRLATADIRQRADERLENQQSVRSTKGRLAGALGMGHQAEDVAAFVHQPGDAVQRTIGIPGRIGGAVGIAVAQRDQSAALDLLKLLAWREVTPLPMGDREPQHL